MGKILYPGLLSLMIGISAQGEATNQSESATSGEFTGGEIVVTAERLRPVEQAGTTRTLDDADLEQRGSQNLTEALSTMPGIYTRVGNDGVERIDIRGFRTRHVNLLLNGVPLNSTFDGQFDSALIPVENIAKVKVGYGNQSVLYGSGGMGGVVNVVTKAGEPGTHGSGEVQVGEGERYIVRGTLSQSSEKVDLFVGASHAQQDYFKLSEDFVPTGEETDNERDNSDYIRNNLLGSATVHFDDDWALGIVGNYMQGEYGKPPNLYDNDDFASRRKHLRVDDYEGLGGQITLNRVKKDDLSVRTAVFFNQLGEEENNYDDNSYTTIGANRSYEIDAENQVYGASLQLSRLVWTGAHLTLGGLLKNEHYEEDRTDYGGGGAVTQSQIDRGLNNAMLGAELEQQLFEDWVLIGGFSGNWQEDDDGEVDGAPSYMLGATYNLFEQTLLHASYAHQIRFPSVKQLYESNGGNIDLEKESSDNYEIGITQGLGERSELDVTAFVRDVNDYIEKVDDGTGTDTNLNHDVYLFYGVETTLDSQLTDNLNGFVSYTWMQTDNRSAGTEIEELQYRPEHVARLGAEWTLFNHLILYGYVQYVVDQVYYSRTTPLQKAELNDYTVVNLRATVAAWDALSLYVGVDNVFDEYYEQSYGVPRAGRTFYVGAKATF